MEPKGRRTARTIEPAGEPAENYIPVAPGESEGQAPVEEPFEELAGASEPAVEQSVLPATLLVPHPAPARDDVAGFGGAAYGALAESGAAFARGLEALSTEFAALACHNTDMAGRAAIETLAVRTWADAVEVHANLARKSFDQWVDGSAKVSELGIRLAVETAKPLIGRLDKIWGWAYPRP